ERRGKPLDEPDEPLEMRSIDALYAAERESDPMQGQRVVATQPLERPHGRPTAHVVLGVDLQPADRRPALEHRLQMRRAQPDPAAGKVHGVLWTRDPHAAVRAPRRDLEVS